MPPELDGGPAINLDGEVVGINVLVGDSRRNLTIPIAHAMAVTKSLRALGGGHGRLMDRNRGSGADRLDEERDGTGRRAGHKRSAWRSGPTRWGGPCSQNFRLPVQVKRASNTLPRSRNFERTVQED